MREGARVREITSEEGNRCRRYPKLPRTITEIPRIDRPVSLSTSRRAGLHDVHVP